MRRRKRLFFPATNKCRRITLAAIPSCLRCLFRLFRPLPPPFSHFFCVVYLGLIRVSFIFLRTRSTHWSAPFPPSLYAFRSMFSSTRAVFSLLNTFQAFPYRPRTPISRTALFEHKHGYRDTGWPTFGPFEHLELDRAADIMDRLATKRNKCLFTSTLRP